MRILLNIRDGFKDVPLSSAQALRKCIAWLVPVAVVQFALGLFALVGEEGMFAAGISIAAIQPLSALLIFLAGLQLNRSLRPHGPLMMASAGLYLFAGLLPFLVGTDEPLIFAFLVAACLGPLVGVATFVLLAGAVWVSAPEEQPANIAWAIGLAFPLAALLCVPIGFAAKDNGMLMAWVFAPQAATGLACLLAYLHMRMPKGELDLVQAVERPEFQDFYLIEHTHPVGVATSIPLPFTPFERAVDGGTPLGNPVLDQLLPVYAKDPQQLAKTLSRHEATVLAVLHTWPKAQVRDSILSWEASLAQIQEKGPNAAETLSQVQADLRSFQALFQDTAKEN